MGKIDGTLQCWHMADFTGEEMAVWTSKYVSLISLLLVLLLFLLCTLLQVVEMKFEVQKESNRAEVRRPWF